MDSCCECTPQSRIVAFVSRDGTHSRTQGRTCLRMLFQVFSFKLRGAFNKMAKLPHEALERGVITSSAGNHAQGVALAASKLVSDRAAAGRLCMA